MCPLMINGYVATTTSVILQFKIKAMTNEAATKPKFCIKIVDRSTTIVRSKVASLSSREARMELELSISSNHPISLLKIAETEHIRSKLTKIQIKSFNL